MSNNDYASKINNIMDKAQADGDLISRQAVMDALCDGCELFKNGEQTCFTKCEEYHFLATLPPVTPQPKTGHWKDFAVWVAKEIFDDEWEYNKDAFAEIACRKLEKLGIVKANGDEWELVEPYKGMPSVAIPTSPCDLCKYNPPSSSDGKPCTMCPAVKMD